MKKLILISLILTILSTPLSLSVNSKYVSVGVSVVKAATETRTATVPERSKESLAKDNLERDENGIIRSADTWTDAFENVTNALMERIALLPIFISSFFVYIAGQLLNFSILETVIKFGEHFKAVKGIDSAWGTLRDLANIFFIFGLLTIAISTILGATNYGYKKLLMRLIIVALIINFSLFFTKFVIDTSNIFALQFYQGASVSDSDGSKGIANTFMKHLGVTSIWETENVLKTLNELNYSESGGFGLMFLYSIFTSIFLMITAFVFMFASIMLITRAVGFILLSILSPLAFAAFVVPATQKWTTKWWDKLWQYAIFAPILLMLFWVIAKIIPDITATFVGKDAGLLDSFSPDPEQRSASIGMILNFIILISLMIASIIIANELSLKGSAALTQVGKNLGKLGKNLGKFGTRTTLRLPFGLAGAIGRNTLGRAAGSEVGKNLGARMALMSPKFGGAAQRVLQGTATANFDGRGPLGKINKNVADLVGTPQVGGYAGRVKQMADKRRKTGEDAFETITEKEINDKTLKRKDKEKRKNELRSEYAQKLEAGVAKTAVGGILDALAAQKIKGIRNDPSLSGINKIAATEKVIKKRGERKKLLQIGATDFVIDRVISPSIYDANMKIAGEMRKRVKTDREATSTSEALKTFNRESQKKLNEIQGNIDDITLKLKHAENERESINKSDTAKILKVEKTIKDLEGKQLSTKKALRDTKSSIEEEKDELQNKERKAKEAKQEFNKEKK